MNNREIYKAAMSGIRPSDEAVERIFDLTVDKKKPGFKQTFKKAVSVALALVMIVVGGGFATDAIVRNYKTNQPLTVMIAYAGDNGKLTFGSKSDQKLFYGIYVAPLNDKNACDNAKKRWQADTTELMNQLDNIDEDSSGSYGKGSFPCYSPEQKKETAVFYTLEGGMFELNLEDYSDVKSFKVNNESKYGLLQFDYEREETEQVYLEQFPQMFDEDYVATDEEIQTFLDQHPEFSLHSHEFALTGDELRYSQDTKTYECGFGKYEQNKGYYLTWCPSEELTYAIGDDPYFDLTQIKDTITFTVAFNDGTVKTASLDLYFDRDGYMHFE